jgi:hypothetical protein
LAPACRQTGIIQRLGVRKEVEGMKTNKFLGRDWIDAELDYSREEWETFIDVGLELKRRWAMGEDHSHILKGKTLFTMFFNQSLRTRSTFAAGIQQLGGFLVDLEPSKTYTPARKGYEIPYKTERICDVAQMLDRVGEAMAIRMYGEPAQWIYGFANATIKEFAEYMENPVINMECDKYHPTQALPVQKALNWTRRSSNTARNLPKRPGEALKKRMTWRPPLRMQTLSIPNAGELWIISPTLIKKARLSRRKTWMG